MRRAACCVAMLVATFTSAVAVAAPPRAAVVALDEDSRRRNLDGEVARALNPTEMTVLYGAELDAWIEQRKQESPGPEVLAKFAPATEAIARGVEGFFYMSPERATSSLQPIVDLAFHHPEVLAFRPDLADQIWQAAIVLVRAYAETKQAELAERYATRIVALFPSREVDPRVVPPETRAVLENARESIAAAGATLRVSVPDAERCTPYVNGARAVVQMAYPIDPSSRYLVRTDCNLSQPPPVWLTSVAASKDVEVFASPIDPQRYETEDVFDVVERRLVEWHLQAVSRVAEADVVVGVSVPDTEDGSVVLVRFDRATNRITWSDGDYGESVRRSLPRIFPEYEALLEPTAAEVGARATTSGPDALALVLLGGGAVSAGAGTFLIISAQRHSGRLDCAVNNPSPLPDAACEGTERRAFDDFEGEHRKVRLARGAGIAAIGLGAAAIGYGIFRLAVPARPEAAVVSFLPPATMEFRW